MSERIPQEAILEAAKLNIALINNTLSARPTLAERLAQEGPITLARRMYFQIRAAGAGEGIGLAVLWPEFPTSRITIEKDGTHIWHQYPNDSIRGYKEIADGKLTPELLDKLWNQKQAHSLIRSFAYKTHGEIERKLTTRS